MASHVLTERTWLNRSRTRVVPAGSPQAAYLLGVAGDEIPEADAKRLGLLDTPLEAASEGADMGAASSPPSDEEMPEDAEAKAVQPAEDKAIHGPEESKAPEPQLERRAVPRRR